MLYITSLWPIYFTAGSLYLSVPASPSSPVHPPTSPLESLVCSLYLESVSVLLHLFILHTGESTRLFLASTEKWCHSIHDASWHSSAFIASLHTNSKPPLLPCRIVGLSPDHQLPRPSSLLPAFLHRHIACPSTPHSCTHIYLHQPLQACEGGSGLSYSVERIWGSWICIQNVNILIFTKSDCSVAFPSIANQQLRTRTGLWLCFKQKS